MMPPRALIMQQIGDDFLACATLTRDDDVAVAAADDFHEIENRAHSRAVADNHLIDGELNWRSHMLTVNNWNSFGLVHESATLNLALPSNQEKHRRREKGGSLSSKDSVPPFSILLLSLKARSQRDSERR